MKITTFGTRGSISVSGPRHVRYGGCTTCVRIESVGLPPGAALAIDGGSGFLPFVTAASAEGIHEWTILHTHYHLDHISGSVVAIPGYDASSLLTLVGPIDDNIGPIEAYDRLMAQPFHPLSFASMKSRIRSIGVTDPDAMLLSYSPSEGLQDRSGSKLIQGAPVPRLEIRAFLASHPSRTLAYRFDEFPSGRTCIFMTDDEVRDPIPEDLVAFLHGADLLITDGQYSEHEYQSGSKRGWGHGTPTYAIELARLGKVKRVALTHHDPLSSDDDVDKLLAEAVTVAQPLGIECTACADGSIFELT